MNPELQQLLLRLLSGAARQMERVKPKVEVGGTPRPRPGKVGMGAEDAIFQDILPKALPSGVKGAAESAATDFVPREPSYLLPAIVTALGLPSLAALLLPTGEGSPAAAANGQDVAALPASIETPAVSPRTARASTAKPQAVNLNRPVITDVPGITGSGLRPVQATGNELGLPVQSLPEAPAGAPSFGQQLTNFLSSPGGIGTLAAIGQAFTARDPNSFGYQLGGTAKQGAQALAYKQLLDQLSGGGSNGGGPKTAGGSRLASPFNGPMASLLDFLR